LFVCFLISKIELSRLNAFSISFLTIKLRRLDSMLGQFNMAQTVFLTTRPKHLKRAIFARKSIRARARAEQAQLKKNGKKEDSIHIDCGSKQVARGGFALAVRPNYDLN